MGSTRLSTPAVATAASIAFPPRLNTCSPAWGGERLTRDHEPVLRHHLGAALRRPTFCTHTADRRAKGGLRHGPAERICRHRLRPGAMSGADQAQHGAPSENCAPLHWLSPIFPPLITRTVSRGDASLRIPWMCDGWVDREIDSYQASNPWSDSVAGYGWTR
jgi:hypothetical protein